VRNVQFVLALNILGAGSGMIGIPYALAEAGFGLGLLLLLLVAGLTDYSLRLMVRAAQLSGTASYQVRATRPLALPAR
jgi:amino acid permease